MPMNRTMMKIVGSAQTAFYKATGGRFLTKLQGNDMVLLTTTGRKSGQQRTTTLLSIPDGENWIVIASNGGNTMDPAWYLNLKANPYVELQVGAETMSMRAETAGTEERARLWPIIVAANKGYQGYQDGVEREIPVVILKPRG